MSEAIALSSPSGRISKRDKNSALKRLESSLYDQRNNLHDEWCECEECKAEKKYYIDLICSSVIDENVVGIDLSLFDD